MRRFLMMLILVACAICFYPIETTHAADAGCGQSASAAAGAGCAGSGFWSRGLLRRTWASGVKRRWARRAAFVRSFGRAGGC